MRTIKFRAWDNEDKTMITHGKLFRLDTSNEEPFLPLLEKFSEKYEVMQFTGLYDRNGTEIYEGDRVELGTLTYEVYVNEFTQEYVIDGFEGQERLSRMHRGVEVIGNIYEDKSEGTDGE